MLISEIFGFGVDNQTGAASVSVQFRSERRSKLTPRRRFRCQIARPTANGLSGSATVGWLLSIREMIDIVQELTVYFRSTM